MSNKLEKLLTFFKEGDGEEVHSLLMREQKKVLEKKKKSVYLECNNV